MELSEATSIVKEANKVCPNLWFYIKTTDGQYIKKRLTLTSKGECIISSTNRDPTEKYPYIGAILYILTKHHSIYHYYRKIYKMKTFTYIKHNNHQIENIADTNRE